MQQRHGTFISLKRIAPAVAVILCSIVAAVWIASPNRDDPKTGQWRGELAHSEKASSPGVELESEELIPPGEIKGHTRLCLDLGEFGACSVARATGCRYTLRDGDM